MSDRTHDLDAERQNARIQRHSAAMELVRNRGLLLSEALTLIDQGGPACHKCGGIRVPHDQIEAHVLAHVERGD